MAVEPWIQRYDCKVICKFSTAQWSAPHIPRLFKDQLYMVPTKSPGKAMVPVSTHMTACYHSALAATLLSVWARSVFKESQMRQAVYEEHDSESKLYTPHKQLQEVFSSTAHTYYVCSSCSGRSECHFFCFTLAFL